DDPYQEVQPQVPKAKKSSLIHVADPIFTIEQEFLCLAIKDKSVLEDFMTKGESLISEPHQKILEALVDLSFENPYLEDADAKFSMLSANLVEDRDLALNLADIGLKLEQIKLGSDRDERFNELLQRLKLSRLRKEIERLKMELTQLDDSSDEWVNKAQEKLSLEKEMQSLLSPLRSL
ncbi:MAG: hypothetical protein OXU45_05945, partial [Candidatus Melainabacteria bacterium]|nr:hypothetical protein [Candidatus Melainabacteria bacterium]